MFLEFAASSNGIVLFLKAKPREWVIECDSTLTVARAFSPTHYYAINYSDQVKKVLSFINQVEALNLVHALLYLLPLTPLILS